MLRLCKLLSPPGGGSGEVRLDKFEGPVMEGCCVVEPFMAGEVGALAFSRR